MAAPNVSGVHKILKDRDTGWSEKLQLAKFAWTSDQCYIPNKQQVLLDWVSSTIANAHQYAIPDDIRRELWKYISFILQSESCKTSGSERLSLKADFGQVLMDHLQSYMKDQSMHHSYLQYIISCCLSVLTCPSLVVILSVNFQKCVEFTVSVVMLAVSFLRQNKETSCDVHILLTATLKMYGNIQRQQANQRQVFTAVYSKLLLPWLQLHSAVNASECSTKEEILKTTEAVVTSGLFHRDHLEAFTSYLNNQKSGKKGKHAKADTDMIENFFKFIQDAVHSEESSSLMHHGIVILYQGFLITQRSSDTKDFAMFRKLSAVIGLTSELLEEPPEDQSIRWNLTLSSLERLLELRVQFDLYSARDDKQQGSVQFSWYQNLLDVLVKYPQRQLASWFTCLRVLLGMNHKILDGKLTLIWQTILTEVQDWNTDARSAHDGLVGDLVDTYTKLHQFDRMFRSLLQGMRSNENINASLSVWKSVQTRCCDSVHALSPSLMLDIWADLITEISTYYLPKINFIETEKPPKKKMKKSRQSCPKVDGEYIVPHQLETIVFLLHGYLSHCNMSEGFTAVISSRMETLMERMQNTILVPIIEISTRGEQLPSSLSRSTLLLFHCYGQIQLLLKVHRMYSQSDSKVCESLEDEIPFWDFNHVFPFVKSGQWKALHQESDKNDLTTKYYLELLNVQKLQTLLINGSSSSGMEQSIKNVVEFICTLPDVVTEQDSNALWDGQLSQICYPVAHWDLICSNIMLLLPHCDSTQISQLVSYMVKTLAYHHGDIQQQRTLYAISHDLLVSENFQESIDLQVSIITEVFKEIENILSRNKLKSKWKEPLSLLVSKEIPWSQQAYTRPRLIAKEETEFQTEQDIGSSKELELNESWQQIQKIAVALNLVMEGKKSGHCQIESSDLNKLLAVLQIVCELKLEYETPSNQSRFILGFLTLQQVLNHALSQKSLQITTLLSKCNDILCRLLQEGTRNVIFDFIDGGSLLLSLVRHVTSALQLITDSGEAAKLRLTYKTSYDKLIGTILRKLYRIPNWASHLDSFISQLASLLQEVDSELETLPESEVKSVQPILSVSAVILGDLITISSNAGDQISGLVKTHCRNLRAALVAVFQSVLQKLPSPMMSESFSELVMVAMVTLKARLEESDAVLTLSEWQTYDPLLEQLMSSLQMRGATRNTALTQSVEFLTLICKSKNSLRECLREDFLKMVWHVIKNLFEHSEESDQTKVEAQTRIEELTETFLKVVYADQLASILRNSSEMLEKCENNPRQSVSVLAIWKVIVKTGFPNESHSILKNSVPRITVATVTLLMTVRRHDNLTLSLLELLDLVLSKRLVEPKMVLHILHGCLSVSLDDVTTEQFPLIFSAVCNVLNSMLLHYSRTVLTALPSYYTCISQLLSCIRKECRNIETEGKNDATKEESDSGVDRTIGCIQQVDRLLSTLATHKVEVCKVAPFLVAEYVSHMQSVSLHPQIMKCSTSGMNTLLDMCDKNGIACVQASLPSRLKENFKSHHADFDKHYKFKGKI